MLRAVFPAIPAVTYGLGVLVALELVYVLLRRSKWVRPGVFYQLWALSSAALVALVTAGLRQGIAWKVTASACALLSCVVVYALVDSLLFQRPWSPARGPIMPKLARDVIRVLLLAATGGLVATMILDQPLPAVLVSSTVLSAVVGLALQDILKNVFAGVGLELEQPFERGDWLLIDGQTVQVIDSSWRSVRMRTRDGVDLWEPNSTLSTSRLLNYGGGQRAVGFNFFVHVVYDAPPFRVKGALVAAGRSTPGVVDSPAPEAFLNAFDDSGISYRLRVWTRNLADGNRFLDAVNSRIWYELHRQGIGMAYPTRTVLLRHAEREERQRINERQQVAVELISQLDFLQDLEGDAIVQLASAARHHHYGNGEMLVREGDMGDSLFVVEHGRVRVTKSGADLDTGVIVLAMLGEGDYFGEMSLLTGAPRSATVTSDGGCEVLVVSKDAFAPVLEKDPQLAELLSRAVAARQAQTAATLEDRRDRARAHEDVRPEASLLSRIRAFFKLPGA
jgi:small-conductance mechanosensitive channel/CRP-like cAMP-binding protein